MKELLRQIETPKEWTQARLRELFPGFHILGDAYGFFAAVPETQCVFVGYTWRELVREVRKHLTGNNLVIPADLDIQLQAQFCEATGSKFCAEGDYNSEDRQTFMKLTSRFLRAMEDAVIHKNLVPQEEAERRAAICAACPRNQPQKFSFCFGCAAKTAAARVAKMTLGKSTSQDSKLRWCGVCHCRLDLKVHVRRETMDYPELADEWDEKCWMRE